MGSQAAQAAVWGRGAQDWADVQEPTLKPVYDFVLSKVAVAGQRLLDVGCGAGLFAHLAAKAGAEVTGFDATEQLLAVARQRDPSVNFLCGEMEELPFDDLHFDIVTGFNSFQFAGDVPHAFQQAVRVLKDDGHLVAVIWGDRADCEAATHFGVYARLAPPMPPNAPGPFALTEEHLLEKAMREAGLQVLSAQDISATWDYRNLNEALRGLMSTGPASRAISFSGAEAVRVGLEEAVKPFTQPDGHILYQNKFRVVITRKSAA